MERISTSLMLAGLCALVSVQAAVGDDINPPPWRGQPGSTFGMWEYLTPDPHPQPDVGIYPYGLPTTTVTPGLFQAWMPVWGGQEGVWPLSGEILVNIPNRPEPLPYKDIWIQLTWAQQAPNVWPAVSEIRFGVPATLERQIVLGPTGEVGGDGLWYHSTYSIRIMPNPDWEQILITGAVNVDELVIDTICAPEPATLGLIVLGGLAVLRRRHRA